MRCSLLILQDIFLIDYIYWFSIFLFRGISSTVRRCIEKETGREFAAKIIDLGAESGDVSSAQMLEATRQEIAILRQVMGHPYIIELQDVFESGMQTTTNNPFLNFSIFQFYFFFSIPQRCLYLPRFWNVSKWWTIRLFNVSCDPFREENPIHYEVKHVRLIWNQSRKEKLNLNDKVFFLFIS